jgi:hypothetical protein
MKNGPGGQHVLQEMQINDSNLQKSGGVSIKSAGGVKRSQNSCNRQMAHPGGFKREQTHENLLPGKPNDTSLMKARPSTSFQYKNRGHTLSQTNGSGSCGLKVPQATFSKQPFQQKTKEIGNTSAQAQS